MVDVFDPVGNDGVWDDEGIDLDEELALLWGIGICIPLKVVPLLSFYTIHLVRELARITV